MSQQFSRKKIPVLLHFHNLIITQHNIDLRMSFLELYIKIMCLIVTYKRIKNRTLASIYNQSVVLEN